MINYYGNEIGWVPKIDNSNTSIYKQIADQIELDINSGKLLPGTKLPPQRIIANYLNINHGTVTRAYKLCEEKGLISGTIGKGTFVASTAGLPLNMLTDHNDNNIISMGMALPLYETNSLIESCIKKVSEQIDYSQVLKYCPSEGHIKHRYIASEWLKNYKINSTPENVIITNGTQSAFTIILITLFNKGDRIIVDEFTYSGLKSLSTYLGIILVPVKGDMTGTDIDELKQVCNRENPKGIYLVPDCNNPTTISLTIEKRIKIAEIIKENDLILIEDAACSFTLKEKLPPISSFVPDQGIYIHGTSKALNPTFRISYLISPSKYTKKLQNGINNITWMASIYGAEILSLFQVSSLYESIVETKLEILKKRNMLFDEIMNGFDFIDSETSLYRYLKLPEGWNDIVIERDALESGVQVISANRFFAGTTIKYNSIRVSVSSPENQEELEKGLLLLKDVINTYDNSYEPII